MAGKAQKRMLKQRRSLLPALVAIVIAAGLGYLGWNYFLSRPAKQAIPVTREAEKPQPATPRTEPSRKPSAKTPPPAPAAKKPGPETPESACLKVSDKIKAFYDYLDGQEYIKAYELNRGIETHLNTPINRLFANPPVVVGETDNLFSILNNTAHFYRVLKKKNLFLVKDILTREHDRLEEMMGIFYRWSLISQDCHGKGIKTRLPLPRLYEYACFFLNTLGGQSYLFRRDSQIRLLTKYYSILILDRANDASLNSHGLDIRPHIDGLIQEMRSDTTLAGHDDYLGALITLQTKYQNVPPGH